MYCHGGLVSADELLPGCKSCVSVGGSARLSVAADFSHTNAPLLQGSEERWDFITTIAEIFGGFGSEFKTAEAAFDWSTHGTGPLDHPLQVIVGFVDGLGWLLSACLLYAQPLVD